MSKQEAGINLPLFIVDNVGKTVENSTDEKRGIFGLFLYRFYVYNHGHNGAVFVFFMCDNSIIEN
ncbi:hypothetical protein [Selenomonas ruminantium]|uniref:hypothetical protein n=1 Tax=Selenomonas ruminantium TaxID=971 RepID=UPI0015A23CC6|nr:hypothetical protein [Selenomonas ruminantium]